MSKRIRLGGEQRRPVLNLETLESRELLSVSVTPSHVNIPPLVGERAVKVAILSDANFDANTIDAAGLKVTATPDGRQIQLTGTPRLRDVNGDGRKDLVAKFDLNQLSGLMTS